MKKLFFISLLSLVLNNFLIAQQDLIMYNMRYVPQRMYTNPANLNNAKVNIGFPIVSSGYFNFGNSGFKYNDLVRKRFDSLYFDVENMVGKLKANNYLFLSTNFDLFSLGIRLSDRSYASINITDKTLMQFRYPKDLIEFAWKGNGALLDKELLFNVGFDFMHYTEYGLNYSYKINDKLRVGARLKYLNGKESIQSKKTDVRLTTESQNFDITAQSDIIINTSGIADTSAFSGGFNFMKYYFGRSNNGFGADLGANYKINDKFAVSGAINDLGYIRWYAHVRNYASKNPGAKFTYEGIELSQFFNDSTSIDEAFQKVGDSLVNTFTIEETRTSYRTNLSPQIYLAGHFNINDNNDLGLLFYGRFFDSKLKPGVSLSYNLRLGRVLGLSAAYSIYNRSYTNVGAGLSFNLGFMQWYLMSDNVAGFIFPQSTKLVHFHTGFNLTIGRDGRDSDKDGIPDKKDECPFDPGPKEYNGCPDRDGDKIIDRLDECPDQPGLADFKGCPDRDNDGVPDKDDDCPDEAGVKDLKGCPDRDEDGIADKDDECPDNAGPAELKGCPDKDGDGLPDHKDECPDTPGLLELNGCPDKDGDGVADYKDRCPEKPGPASNEGCPEVKLKLIDENGNVIAVAIQDKEGLFRFTQLPADEKAMFIIEGEDTDNLRIVKVVGPSGIIKNAFKDDNGKIYRFVQLKPELNTMKKEEAKDVVIKLNKEEEEILKKAFDNLEFETAKAIIRESSLASLDELAALLQKKPSWRLKISGHTDNQGKPATNMQLSKNRALAVKNYLMTKGISEDRFKVEWFGQTKPIADNKTPEGRQKNRRVEMLIIE
jgi:outer membrane protein OmpA-like peptidoglycan-associated protein